MCMQNFITIVFTVLEIGSVSLFQNLELGKASTNKNVSSQSLGLDLANINVYAKVYQNIPLSSRDRAIFTLFRIWYSAKPRPMINVIFQFLGLDLFNIKLSAKFYQNIPNGLWVNFTFFRIWTSTKPRPIPNVIWQSQGLHLVNIPMCMQNFITIFHSVQEIGPFSLFQNLELGKASTDKKLNFTISWARSW